MSDRMQVGKLEVSIEALRRFSLSLGIGNDIDGHLTYNRPQARAVAELAGLVMDLTGEATDAHREARECWLAFSAWLDGCDCELTVVWSVYGYYNREVELRITGMLADAIADIRGHMEGNITRQELVLTRQDVADCCLFLSAALSDVDYDVVEEIDYALCGLVALSALANWYEANDGVELIFRAP